MVFTKVFSVSIFLVLFLFVSGSDYCDLENSICKQEKHIGCDNSNFKPNPQINMRTMTEELKIHILHEFNTYRNAIAMGKYAKEGFPNGSNIRSLRWNNEFGYLAKLTVQNSNWDISTCVVTKEFGNAKLGRYYIHGVFTDEIVFQNLIIFFTSRNEKKENDPEFYDANNYQIGCAFGSQRTKDSVLTNISCIFNKHVVAYTASQAYDFGTPCSKCGVWNEVCGDDRYPALCVPNNLHGERGPIGLRGPPCNFNDFNFNYPMSFWILYALMGIGVLVSIALSLAVIITGYKIFTLVKIEKK